MAGTSSSTDPYVFTENFSPAADVDEKPVASTSTQIVADEQNNVERHFNDRSRIETIYNQKLSKVIEEIFGRSSSEDEVCVEDFHVKSKSNSDEVSSLPFSRDDSQDNADSGDEDENLRMCNSSIVDVSTNVLTIDQDNSKKMKLKENLEILDKIRICSVCLGDESNYKNKFIDCNECGVSVHEDCYGVKNSDDTGSVCSSNSSSSTEPWFCDPCKAGIKNPTCELCPNFGGIFKETDYGSWVHLVCALYMPGTLFGDNTKIALFSNTSPKWGSKRCDLCKDIKFMYTGVTISCDARMCQSNFHVTCAQQEGGLSEATSPETDKTDPFYGHCKLHVDKFSAKKKIMNWEILQLRTKQMKLFHEQQFTEKKAKWQRNQPVLEQLQSKNNQMKKYSEPKLTVKSKIAHPVTPSDSACQALPLKASLMGINSISQEAIEGQIKALHDEPKKCHMSPTFSLEFVSYFFDRNTEITNLKNKMNDFIIQKSKLHEELIVVTEKYNQAFDNNKMQKQKLLELRKTILDYHYIINVYNPNAKLPDVDSLINECHTDNSNVINSSTSTFATLKSNIGFSTRHDDNSEIIDHKMHLKLNNKCYICDHYNDQHLLAKCDVCNLYYHLSCLDPPLSKIPKKTKICGWQCNECIKTESDCVQKTVNPNSSSQLKRDNRKQSTSDNSRSSYINNNYSTSSQDQKLVSDISNKKKYRRHRQKYSPKLFKSNKGVKSHKCNRKHQQTKNLKSGSDNDLIGEPPLPGIKIFIKSVPSADGVKKVSHLVVTPPVDKIPQTFTKAKPEKSVTTLKATTNLSDTKITKCDICKTTEMCSIMIQCDECSQYYHLSCLVPPLKKSPKIRGYSWHCTECDPTDSSD